MKKFLLALIFSLVFCNVSFAEMTRAEEAKFLVNVWISDSIRPSYKYRHQFDGIVIDGKTAVEIEEKLYNEAKAKAEAYLGSEEAEKEFRNCWAVKTKYLKKFDECRDMNDICIARNLFRVNNRVTHMPDKYLESKDREGYTFYTHWMARDDGKENECSHYNFQEMKNHYQAYNEMMTAKVTILQNFDKFKKFYKDYKAIREIFYNQYENQFTEFYKVKEKELQEIADKVNRGRKWNCTAGAEFKDAAHTKLKEPSGCQRSRACFFSVSGPQYKPTALNELYKLECKCGHDIDIHLYPKDIAKKK